MTNSPFFSFADTLQEELHSLQSQGFQRQLRQFSPHLRSFAHNDYLGLARDPRPAQAAMEVLQSWGSGAQSARLITGHSPWHEALETSLARLKQTEACLTFPSGYAAATGTLPALLRSGDYVVLDKLCHACLFDGAKLSGAQIKIFNHNDLQHADEILKWIRLHSPAGTRVLLVAESLYSMDGDFASLAGLVELKNRHGAWLMIDEAHATGLYGPSGQGLISAANLSPQVDIQMGTLSKAIGVHGGFISGSRSLVDLLLHKARSFLFTTGTPPSLAAAALCSINIITSPEGDTLRSTLQSHIAAFEASFSQSAASASPIQILMVGEEFEASRIAQTLLDLGYIVPAVRFPTVPLHQARLRLILNSRHSLSNIQELLGTLHQHFPNLSPTRSLT